MDILTYSLSKKYTEETVAGLGVLKGAPCTIQSIVEDDSGNLVTFKWTGTDGTEKTANMSVQHGISIVNVEIDKNSGRLICTMSDGTTITSQNSIGSGMDNSYSTTETVVGTWIDGKPIYRKSYSFEINDTFISKTLETVAIDNIIKVYGSCGGGNSLMRPVPYDGRTSQVDYSGANTSSSTEYSEVFYQASDTTLRFTAKSQSAMTKAVVVVEYTKA